MLVKKVNAIGKAKMVQEEDNSDFSDSVARSASIAIARQVTGRMWNLDLACSNTLVTPRTEIYNQQPSCLTLQTAENSLIKASVSGTVKLPIRGLGDIKAHVIPNLSEPLLSVSDLTDKTKAVVFLKTHALIVDQPDQLEKWCQDSNTVSGEGTTIHRLYYLDKKDQVSFRTAPASSASFLT